MLSCLLRNAGRDTHMAHAALTVAHTGPRPSLHDVQMAGTIPASCQNLSTADLLTTAENYLSDVAFAITGTKWSGPLRNSSEEVRQGVPNLELLGRTSAAPFICVSQPIRVRAGLQLPRCPAGSVWRTSRNPARHISGSRVLRLETMARTQVARRPQRRWKAINPRRHGNFGPFYKVAVGWFVCRGVGGGARRNRSSFESRQDIIAEVDLRFRCCIRSIAGQHRDLLPNFVAL